jgi:hypothetical protein
MEHRVLKLTNPCILCLIFTLIIIISLTIFFIFLLNSIKLVNLLTIIMSQLLVISSYTITDLNHLVPLLGDLILWYHQSNYLVIITLYESFIYQLLFTHMRCSCSHFTRQVTFTSHKLMWSSSIDLSYLLLYGLQRVDLSLDLLITVDLATNINYTCIVIKCIQVTDCTHPRCGLLYLCYDFNFLINLIRCESLAACSIMMNTWIVCVWVIQADCIIDWFCVLSG